MDQTMDKNYFDRAKKMKEAADKEEAERKEAEILAATEAAGARGGREDGQAETARDVFDVFRREGAPEYFGDVMRQLDGMTESFETVKDSLAIITMIGSTSDVPCHYLLSTRTAGIITELYEIEQWGSGDDDDDEEGSQFAWGERSLLWRRILLNGGRGWFIEAHHDILPIIQTVTERGAKITEEYQLYW